MKITVEYIKDGNKHNKSFTLKRPKNEDEFNVNNKFVRIVNLFGDRKNDPASLKYRDIWLKEENGVVKLDVPKKASLISKYKKKINRITKGFVNVNQDIFKHHVISSLFLLIVSISVFTLISITNVYGLTDTIYLNMYGISFYLFTIVMTLFSAMFIRSKRFVKYSVVMITILTTASIISYSFGLSELSYQLVENGDLEFAPGATAQSIFNNLLLLIAPYWLTTVSYIGLNESLNKSYKSIKNRFGSAKSKLKRKYQSLKGIEYIATDN